jgi:glycosyltransferase involved in cell wall biosynthesis
MPDAIKELTVLMPAYNSANTIAQSIKSVLNQTHKDFEFIIVNDGSTDNTEEIILSFDDSRIKYFKTEHKGTSAAMNFGIAKAQYKWIARIDSDDLNIPTRLETQINFLNENPGIDILSSRSIYFNEKGKILFFIHPAVLHKDIVKTLDLHNPVNQSGLIFRKSILKKEKYNEKLQFNEDFELMHRIKESVKFHNIPEYLVYTRLSEGSKSFFHRKNNVHDFLFNPAFKNLLDSKSKGDHFYWASTIAWVNFFYGNKKDSRNFFKTSISFKNIISYLATLLPEKTFDKLINYRIRYRFRAFFTAKKKYYSELNTLLR